MASRDRVYSLNEARSGRAAPARRRPPRDRAEVLPTDPSWLHEGTTLRLTHRGEPLDLFPISVLARGVGRSPGTVRRWIDAGLLPEAEFRSPSRFVCGQSRLWRREDVLATAAAVAGLGITGSRPRQWEGSALPKMLRATSATM